MAFVLARVQRLGRGLGWLPDARIAAHEQAVRTMLTPKVTPIRHTGPSPYAPLVPGSTARK
jgi:hypothetical protein